MACFSAKLNLEAQSLRWTGWMPLFEDVDNKSFLYHTKTESVRAAPWILLRHERGCVYFANLVTRETRWLPPRTWMPDWISRPRCCPREGIEIDNPIQTNRCFIDLLLPRGIARKRVEGGARYMHEHGEPHYAPHKDNSEQTYPRGK